MLSICLPVNVNVVPRDIAAGRIADPVVRAERLIIDAQSEKSLASDEIRAGKTSEASSRLKGVAAGLRLEAVKISDDNPRNLDSKARIKAEADEMDLLANTAEVNEIAYSAEVRLEPCLNYRRLKRSAVD